MGVYEILFPPNEKYKAFVHLAVLNKKKEMVSLGGCFFEDLPKRIEELNVMKSRDYYITANAFIPFRKRHKDTLLSLHNVVIDMDIHTRMNQHRREELISELSWRIKRDLFDIPEPFNIPKANIIHTTTRGIQLWFSINSTSSRLWWLYTNIVRTLVEIFKQFLSEYPELEQAVTIDASSSIKLSGLFRLFDTWNTHTGKKTEYEILHSGSIDINEFFQKICEHDAIKEKERRMEQDIERYQKNKKTGKKSEATKKQASSYDALHRKRLAFIKWWDTQQEDSIGKRDLMVYLGFNTCIQLMNQEDARKWCKQLNSGFTEPLSDITYIFKEIKKPFKIRNSTFYEMLGAEQEDVQRFENEYSKVSMNLTRNAEIQKRKAIRKQKTTQAQKMITEGTPYKEIAQAVGLSISTIKRIAATVKVRKKLPKPWDELGISKSTYYRKLKNPNA